MTAPIVFLDTETTGLDPELHEIWEVGLILRLPVERPVSGVLTSTRTAPSESRHHWFVQVDLKNADPKALDIGRFHERYDARAAIHPDELVYQLNAHIPHKAHLVGAVISFDAERLARLYRYHPAGLVPPWHYHLIDVEAMVAGHLGIEPPWTSEDLSGAMGVLQPSETERHTALGDAEWVMRLYDKVMAEALSRNQGHRA